MTWVFLSKGPSKYSKKLFVSRDENFPFWVQIIVTVTSTKKSLSLTTQITVADFFMKISLSRDWKHCHVSMVCYKPWNAKVTDFPRATTRVTEMLRDDMDISQKKNYLKIVKLFYGRDENFPFWEPNHSRCVTSWNNHSRRLRKS